MADAGGFENRDRFLLNDDLIHSHSAAPDTAAWRQPLLHHRDLSTARREVKRRRQTRWAGSNDHDIALNGAQQLPMVAVHNRSGDQRFFEFVHRQCSLHDPVPTSHGNTAIDAAST